MRLGRLIAVCALASSACGGAGGKTVPPRSATCDVTATWTGSAVDPAGLPWQVLLVLHHEGANVVGTAEWTHCDGAAGASVRVTGQSGLCAGVPAKGDRFVEDVRGAVDCASGVVTLRTPPPPPGDETAMVATYRLELGADDRSFTGSWDNGSGQGTLEATRK